jgi:hypothetical protein
LAFASEDISLKTKAFPVYAEWLINHCKNHEDIFVRDSWKMIDYCFQMDLSLPDKYGWRFSSVDVLKLQIDNINDPKELNRIYWIDQARNIEAYSITTFWRGIELLKPAIRSLNIQEVVTPAVLARSLLELSCVFLIHANNMEKNLSMLTFPPNAVVISAEFEEMIVKMIWGTRYGNPEDYTKQNNILGFIQKVSKNPNAANVQDTYEYLCDIAHPSFIGNTRFWSHIEKINPDGSESRFIARRSTGESTSKIVDKIIWTLGWSAAVLRNSYEILESGLKHLLDKIS